MQDPLEGEEEEEEKEVEKEKKEPETPPLDRGSTGDAPALEELVVEGTGRGGVVVLRPDPRGLRPDERDVLADRPPAAHHQLPDLLLRELGPPVVLRSRAHVRGVMQPPLVRFRLCEVVETCHTVRESTPEDGVGSIAVRVIGPEPVGAVQPPWVMSGVATSQLEVLRAPRARGAVVEDVHRVLRREPAQVAHSVRFRATVQPPLRRQETSVDREVHRGCLGVPESLDVHRPPEVSQEMSQVPFAVGPSHLLQVVRDVRPTATVHVHLVRAGPKDPHRELVPGLHQ